jgi:hypothetical protein
MTLINRQESEVEVIGMILSLTIGAWKVVIKTPCGNESSFAFTPV